MTCGPGGAARCGVCSDRQRDLGVSVVARQGHDPPRSVRHLVIDEICELNAGPPALIGYSRRCFRRFTPRGDRPASQGTRTKSSLGSRLSTSRRRSANLVDLGGLSLHLRL